jgi:hypothetical protein
MRDLVDADPSTAERISRFIGGADLNSLPDLTPARFIIDLDGLSEQEARQWPALFAVAERYVKPQRLALPDTRQNRRLRQNWWHYSQGRAIRDATRGLPRVLVCSQTSKWRAFAYIDGTWIFDQKVIGFAHDGYALFTILQSRPHEFWSDFFGSTLGDQPVYNPPRCFDAFPFPHGWNNSESLGRLGAEYYEHRQAVMRDGNQGLTSTYNRFHDPEEHAPEILQLRELHGLLDLAVLDAYGWADIPVACEFLLDYEIDEETRANGKKPWRYRWPDDVRDDVLGRLLELNQARAAEEERSGSGGASERLFA